MTETKLVALEDRIRARIEELKHQREALLQQANTQLAALAGAIQELEGLLAQGEKADAIDNRSDEDGP